MADPFPSARPDERGHVELGRFQAFANRLHAIALGWRAALLTALVLKARGATTQFLLLLDTGRRVSNYLWDPMDSFETRTAGFLQWTTADLAHARKERARLNTASEGLAIKIAGHRKHAKLPKLVDLLFDTSAACGDPFPCKAASASDRAIAARMRTDCARAARTVSGPKDRPFRLAIVLSITSAT